MIIQVTRFYQDIHRRTIHEGTYHINDKKLKGMGVWLVDNGFAEVLEMPEEPVEFTSHATALLNEAGFDESAMDGWLEANPVDKVQKGHVQAFLDELSEGQPEAPDIEIQQVQSQE